MKAQNECRSCPNDDIAIIRRKTNKIKGGIQKRQQEKVFESSLFTVPYYFIVCIMMRVLKHTHRITILCFVLTGAIEDRGCLASHTPRRGWLTIRYHYYRELGVQSFVQNDEGGAGVLRNSLNVRTYTTTLIGLTLPNET